ncbi:MULTISPECIES: hypothetical protein [unclassified Crossiella]|uniref:hypothetical protein n=1 Tax=unclassified Crossiella TaxID=2620835 RepID=UPI001FFF6E2E|nr:MULTISPECIES: hypothetical protein [unclassified Crossiella]MCK2238946.1 hypothetical protein [Crossiella sp. S99.2]MCK2251484.1 hypothetical protein [Crossiella sp. S99.1]
MIGTVLAAALLALPGAPVGASVTGTALIQMQDPVSVFEVTVAARGDAGTIRVAHHYQGESGWLTGIVDCVRTGGPVGVVTGKVDRVHGIGWLKPGDRFSLSVYDRGRRDLIGMAWQAEAAHCLGPAPDRAITGGNLKVGAAAAD